MRAQKNVVVAPHELNIGENEPERPQESLRKHRPGAKFRTTKLKIIMKTHKRIHIPVHLRPP